MNRQEEINKMAKEIASYITSDKDVQVAFCDTLKRGAEWADAHPHWISVEDELPCENDIVLTANKQGGVSIGYYADDDGWWSTMLNDGEPPIPITHWMPLPEPPIHSNVEKIGKDLKGGEE